MDRSASRKFIFTIFAVNRQSPAFVQATNQWARASGQMLLNVLNNKEGAFAPFP